MTCAAINHSSFTVAEGTSQNWDIKSIRYLLYLIFFFHWFGSFEPVRLFLGLGQDTDGIGMATFLGANVRVEDALTILLGTLVFVTIPQCSKVIQPILRPIVIFMGIGLFVLTDSILMKGFLNLFGNFRLYAWGVIGVGAALAFEDARELYRFLWFVLIIWFVELGYQLFFVRLSNGAQLLFEKNVYGNWFFAMFGFMVALAVQGSNYTGRWLKFIITGFIFLFFVLVILSGFRSVWLATTTLIIILSVLRRDMKQIVAFLIALVGVAVIFSLIGSDFSSFVSDKVSGVIELTGSAQMREVAWKILAERWQESPLFGHGLGAGGENIDLYFLGGGGVPLLIGSAHNAHLIFLYYIGIFGVGSYVILSINIAMKGASIKGGDKFLVSIARTAVAGLGGFYLHSAATPLGPGFHYYLWFYLGVLASVITIAERHAGGAPRVQTAYIPALPAQDT